MKNVELISVIKKNMQNTFLKSDLKKLGPRESGKVRDLYTIDDKIIIITTDRISAFDVILKQGIPYKGQALNQTSQFWFKATENIIKNHIIAYPDPNVMVVKKCKPIGIEAVIRGYITGSAWRRYKTLKEKGEPLIISGVEFPNNLQKDEKLPKSVFTPTTKALSGHDEEISPKEIISQGLVTEETLNEIESIAFKLFKEGNKIVGKKGGILVDTKYEFGFSPNEELVLIDEIHTADSSRYWIKDKYEELFENGLDQQGLDKEYIRTWLRNHNFSGEGPVPDLPSEVIINAALNVIDSYELITNQSFKPSTPYVSNERLIANLSKFIKK